MSSLAPAFAIHFLVQAQLEHDRHEQQLAELDALLVPVQLDPLAQLLLALHQSGVMGPKPDATCADIPKPFWCDHCRSPRTRMKGLTWILGKLQDAIAFDLRCRICGGLNRFRPHDLKRAA